MGLKDNMGKVEAPKDHGDGRRSTPTAKMREFAEKIASGLKIDEPDMYSFDSVKQFIDEHGEKFKNRAPSKAQLEFAEKIAESSGISLPETAKKTSMAISAWINEHKSNAVFGPSDKQIAFAEKLSAEKGIEIPEEAMRNGKKMGEWLDKHVTKKR